MKKLLLKSILFIHTISTIFSSELTPEVLEITTKVFEYYEEEEYLKIIEKLEQVEELTPDLTYLLAESYLFSITDAKSWMKYNNKYQDIVVKCLENDPENILYQINSARGMMWFPSARGTRDDGINILLNLEKQHPGRFEVLFATSNYRFGEGLIEEAKQGYLGVLEIDPYNKKAKEMLDIIELDEKRLEIRNITFIENKKTPEKRLLKKISKYRGATLDQDSRSIICNTLMEISSINGARIRGHQVDDNYVDLEIEIFEESSKILMFQQISGAGLGFDKDIFLSGMMPPVSVYIDNNFLGTGSQLTFITVFVYNQLQLTLPGLIDDKYLDFKEPVIYSV